MADQNKNNFWNNWDFKSILQILLIIFGFAIAYTKLEAKVENDKLLLEKDVVYLKSAIDNLGFEIKSMREELKRINPKYNNRYE